MKNFSTCFGLYIDSHREIGFVDVPVNTDIGLYLDPTLIEVGSDSFAHWCADGIDSFFGAVFQACAAEDTKML